MTGKQVDAAIDAFVCIFRPRSIVIIENVLSVLIELNTFYVRLSL